MTTASQNVAASHGDVSRFARIGFVAFLWLSFVGLYSPALSRQNVDALSRLQSGGGDPSAQIASIMAFIGFAVLAPPRWRVTFPVWLALTLAWLWLSLAWGGAPEVAVRRVAQTTLVVATVFFAVRALGPYVAIDLLALTLAAIVVLDTAAALFLPGGVQAGPVGGLLPEAIGSWRGLHVDKNAAGAVCALEVLFSLFRATRPRVGAIERGAWMIAAALGVYFLYRSGSKTSLALVPVASCLGLGALLLSRSRWICLLLVIAVLPVGAAALLIHPELVADLQDRISLLMSDPQALTGRVQIWQILVRYISEHPWLGSGYGAYWSVGPTGPFALAATGWLQTVPNAHNGYLDLLAQAGAVGLALGVFSAIIAPLCKLLARPVTRPAVRWLTFAVLFFFTFHNALETSIFDRARPPWVVLLILLAAFDATARGRIGAEAGPQRAARASSAGQVDLAWFRPS